MGLLADYTYTIAVGPWQGALITGLLTVTGLAAFALCVTRASASDKARTWSNDDVQAVSNVLLALLVVGVTLVLLLVIPTGSIVSQP
jgi:hypothetical protein